MSLIDSPELAKRLARAIVSDISIYNDDRVVRGIQSDNLFEELEEQLGEGRALYNSRVESALRETTNFFERAVVDMIFKGRGQRVESTIW